MFGVFSLELASEVLPFNAFTNATAAPLIAFERLFCCQHFFDAFPWNAGMLGGVS